MMNFNLVVTFGLIIGSLATVWSTSLKAASGHAKLGRDGPVKQILLSPADQLSLYGFRSLLKEKEIANRLGVGHQMYLTQLFNLRHFNDPIQPETLLALSKILGFDPTSLEKDQTVAITARERLYLRRLQAMLTLTQLAELAGLKRSYLEGLELGRYPYQVSRELAEQLADPLKCSPDDLISETSVQRRAPAKVVTDVNELSHPACAVFSEPLVPVLESVRSGTSIHHKVRLMRHPLQDRIEGRLQIPLSASDQTFLKSRDLSRKESPWSTPAERVSLQMWRKGWSIKKLSKQSGLPATSIWRYMQFASSDSLEQRYCIRFEAAKALAAHLECPHQDLVYDPQAVSEALLRERLDQLKELANETSSSNGSVRDLVLQAKAQNWAPNVILEKISQSIGLQPSQLVYDFDHQDHPIAQLWLDLNRAVATEDLPPTQWLMKAYRDRLALPIDALASIWNLDAKAAAQLERRKQPLTVSQTAQYAYGLQLSSIETLALVYSYLLFD